MKKVTTFILFVAVALVAVMPAFAAKNGVAGKSETAHLYLYEKNNSDWSIVEGGAWGKLMYKDDFVFNGHKLVPGQNYTLIRYLDPWASHVATCLGSAVANEGGEVHIQGTMKEGGPKVWLVLSKDVNCESEKMTAWHGPSYLYEYQLIP